MRPLAWPRAGPDQLRLQLPKSRPIWVSRRRPESCSSSVGSTFLDFTKIRCRSESKACGTPRLTTTSRKAWKYPWASSCSRKVAPNTKPVASSIAPTKVSQGRRPSSQSWRLPSTWARHPSWAIRSRRRRSLAGRRFLGAGTPTALSHRSTVALETGISSRSASISVKLKWWRLKPWEVVVASSITCFPTSDATAFAGRRPRLPWARVLAPSLR